ncbi:MAG: hypothetical protein K0R33_4728, partial [Mycobacterium sp.]|nr:hypothetical protein [Mycobacterium sp.]
MIQSQIAIPQVKPAGTGAPPDDSAPPTNGSARAISVVSAAPTHTRNMTGLRTRAAGLSLRSAPGSAPTSVDHPKARTGVDCSPSATAIVASVFVV